MPEQRFLSEMFLVQPPHWGLRGDPFLWEDMKKAFAETPFPYSAHVLVMYIHRLFLDTCVEDVRDTAGPFVASYEQHGRIRQDPGRRHGALRAAHTSLHAAISLSPPCKEARGRHCVPFFFAAQRLLPPEEPPFDCHEKGAFSPEEGSFFIRRKTSVDVFAALDAIDDGGNHDRKINEDAAYAHKALRGGVQGAGDEFSHTVLLESLDCPPANIPESAFILPQQRQKVKAES